MKLYGAKGGCSQASHIALYAAGVPFTFIGVGRDKQTDDGRDFKAINPKGYTPALEMDDGTILSESLVILSYIADLSGKLLAKSGLARWRVLEATEFMTTEVHGSFRPFFYPDASDAEKSRAGASLVKHFAVLAERIGSDRFLGGDELSIADAYLFVMLSWAGMMGISVPERLTAFAAHMKELDAVKKALAAEGFG